MELINAKLDIILEKLINLEKINNKNNSNENNDINNNSKNDSKNDIITTIKTIKSNTSFNSLNLTDNLKKTYKELKIEDFDIEYEFIKSCLLMNSINGDIRLFKRMYIDNVSKEYYPIRHIKKKFQYWINEHMEDDNTNGKYIKDTIIQNIERCYLKINTYENFGNNSEQFMKNQEHIDNITEQKYKDKFLTQIINIINI
jgi:hypothetical protein